MVNTVAQADTSPKRPDFDVHLEDLDFVDEAITQAEINLIEHYFQDLLTDLLKGPPP